MRVVIGVSRTAVLASLLFSFSALAQDAAVQFKDFLSQVQSAEGELFSNKFAPLDWVTTNPKSFARVKEISSFKDRVSLFGVLMRLMNKK